MRSRAIIVGLILGAVAVSGGWLMHSGLRAQLGSDRVSNDNGPQLFQSVLAHVRSDYLDSLADSTLYRKAVEGLLLELHDPHSVFLSRARLDRLNESTRGEYAGVGIRMDVRDGWITVITPLPRTPAERAGLMTGDRLVEIEGKSTRGWTSEEASRALRGAPRTTVRVLIERPGMAARLPVTLAREAIHFRSVQHALMLDDGVGYVDLSVFADSSTAEVRAAIDSLVGAGMKALVFDLRGDPGGLLAQGVAVADLFLDRGDAIVTMRGRDESATRNIADDAAQRWPSLPIAVLIDSGSASASEIVAGALQDHDRALLVGTTSYGKGSAQSLYPLPDGAVKLTTALWYTPSGRSINRPHPSLDDDAAAPALRSADEIPARPAFRTDAGRTVLGGGGITPDVIVGDTIADAATIALERALGRHVSALRDAMTALALDARARRTVSDRRFVVTGAMRDDLYARLVQRGVEMPRATYDAASPVIDRLLGYTVARYVFGPLAEYERVARDDAVIQRAVALVRGVSSPRALIERGTTVSEPRSASPSAARK